MHTFKKLINGLLTHTGLKIIKLNGYNTQQEKIKDIILLANKFYKENLLHRYDRLSDSEFLQFLELKFGGYVTDVPATIDKSDVVKIKGIMHTGGDRMSVFFNNYSSVYSKYLENLRRSEKTIHILEVGILQGTGLAIWDVYFENKKIYGFDYDLGNFERNINSLLELGAFSEELPTLKFYDQFANNSKTLEETFGTQRIDVVIDDAHHSDESIINTFNELLPFLSKSFIYFIEDNKSAFKKLQIVYPKYKFAYKNNGLTVVTNFQNV